MQYVNMVNHKIILENVSRHKSHAWMNECDLLLYRVYFWELQDLINYIIIPI